MAVDGVMPASPASSWTRASGRVVSPSSRPYWDSVSPPFAAVAPRARRTACANASNAVRKSVPAFEFHIT